MISFLAMKRWNSKKSLKTNENWSRKTKPTPPLQVMLDAKDQQTTQGTLSSRQLCKTAAAPRKVGILPWCFVAMKIHRCKGSMPKHPKPWGCRDLGPDDFSGCSVTALTKPDRLSSAAISTNCTSTQQVTSCPMPGNLAISRPWARLGSKREWVNTFPFQGIQRVDLAGRETHCYAATTPSAHRHNTGSKAGMA